MYYCSQAGQSRGLTGKQSNEKWFLLYPQHEDGVAQKFIGAWLNFSLVFTVRVIANSSNYLQLFMLLKNETGK